MCCTTAHHAPRATMLEFGGYDVANAYKTINQVNLNASDDNRWEDLVACLLCERRERVSIRLAA